MGIIAEIDPETAHLAARAVMVIGGVLFLYLLIRWGVRDAIIEAQRKIKKSSQKDEDED